jgi:hypothetical protein
LNSPHKADIGNVQQLSYPGCEAIDGFGGRTRTRTLDPLIKSKLLLAADL